MRNDNTVYVRMSRSNAWYRYEALVKALGDGAIVGGVGRDDAIKAGATVLWAINKWGPDEWKKQGALNEHPECPTSFDYPVVDEL